MKFAKLSAAVLAGAFAAQAAMACSPDSSTSWTVSIDEASSTLQPKDLEVCNGDVVTWTNNGPSQFHVIFRAGGPPGSPSPSDNWYSVTINAQPGEYVYDVKINGTSLDPRIIVRP
jgi:plastocyanin